jgi:aldose sugar dehydrogenase
MNLRLASAAILTLICAGAHAQLAPLGNGPWQFDTYAPFGKIKVSVVARGIEHPWGMAFLPNGNILVAERAGQVRLISQGKLGEKPIDGPVPGKDVVGNGSFVGLMDVVLHPEFKRNRWVYFTYMKAKPAKESDGFNATTAMGRARLSEDETRIEHFQELFVADAWSGEQGGYGSRLRFAKDGTLFMTSPFRREPSLPQNPLSDIAKVLRLNDDGSIPKDNPFVGNPKYLPEIYSMGNRAVEGLAFHPKTGELWAVEHGPQGGDEINILKPAANYGWDSVSYGREYDGSKLAPHAWQPGITEPELLWIPSIAPSGAMFYTGNKFPNWQNNLFVGSLMTARIPATGHIERIMFNEHGEQGRERLLTELKQRIRDVQQGPDGLIYVLTEEHDGALLVIEPVQP